MPYDKDGKYYRKPVVPQKKAKSANIGLKSSFFMERKGESKSGIASLILSLIALIIFVLKLAFIFFRPQFLFQIFPAGFYIFLFIAFITLLSLVSFCLGLFGIFQKTRVRKFAFIGTTISSAILIVYILDLEYLYLIELPFILKYLLF